MKDCPPFDWRLTGVNVKEASSACPAEVKPL
jgi:hypothetical protein